MPDLKLARLPDRTPVKITINLLPELNETLVAYAEVYSDAYGQSEGVADLIPYMLRLFLDSDRKFVKARSSTRAGRPGKAA